MCHEAACPEQDIRRRMESHLEFEVYGLILYLIFLLLEMLKIALAVYIIRISEKIMSGKSFRADVIRFLFSYAVGNRSDLSALYYRKQIQSKNRPSA